MSDQSKLGLGKIITTEQHRDAIHVAVAPVVAGVPLKPGDHVSLDENAKAFIGDNPIGVVDPFLSIRGVNAGEKFWLFLYPGTITSLRHDWEHPAFTWKSSPAEDNLRKFAARLGWGYEELMDTLSEACREGRAHGGDDNMADLLNDNKEELFQWYA